jgi:hypothetical protein
MHRSLLASALVILLCSTSSAEIDFNRDIRPILSENCYACHGPDAAERKAGLRLDQREGALLKLDSGEAAIVPGDLEHSSLLARITAADPDVVMPPPATGKKLTDTQLQLLRQWIAEGAEYKGHWAFIPPVSPALPEVSQPDWCQNPIDRFILAKLDQSGLAPSPRADRVTLIRRLTLDLTGLPPTPQEVQEFLADQSPDAYERLVDRLLASERYGEQMARYWLDLVRYGDTHGLHLDNERALWKYREWVINAFNRNLPYDQFTIEQMAGDLLPEPTIDQKIATGFNRCNVTTGEGGSINEEVLVRYAVDRTTTMGTIYLGMTLTCSVCHDHKYDPISQKEFYQLYAFYNAAADAAMDGNALAPPPLLKVPTPEMTARLQELDAQLAATKAEIASALQTVEYTDPGLPAGRTAGEPFEHIWIEDTTPPGAKQEGNSPWEFVSAPDHPVYSGEQATRREAAGLSQHFFTGANPGLKIGEGDKLFAYCWIDPANPPETVMLQFNDGSWEHRMYWGKDAIPFGSGDTPGHRHGGELPAAGAWVRLEVDAAHVGLKSGSTLNGWAFTQHGGLVYWDHAGIVTRTPQDGQAFESLAAWDAYERTLQQSSVPQPVKNALKVDPAQRSEQQSQLIREHFLQHVYPGTRGLFDPLNQRVADLTKQRTETDNAIPVTMVMADLPQPRDTFVLKRGEYDKPLDKVTAAVPEIFPPLPEGAAPNRLGLAQWLVSRQHPLTARVTVNRLWQQIFGTGIVKTAEDFGSQGDWPSHPDLLDWLAVHFMETGWDVKAFLKLLAMSATYQQSSHVTPELLAVDAENRLLARGARFRCDAEVVRDSALYVSGLLVESVGGKSVRPYQPPGIWEAVAFQGSTTQNFKRDDGEALYRRSLYTFWKRTAPPPSLMAFDAPSREVCVARRARTNTPLQALVLMNDEQYVEASRRLAERLLREGGATPQDQLRFGFAVCTGRTPDDRELSILSRIHSEQFAHFSGQVAEGEKLLSIGEAPRDQQLPVPELAAMTMMANLLLNLDETITRE